jgi:uncharacterized protein YjbI with pentapeptide repeats
MEEETNYHTIVKICIETEAIYTRELKKIGLKKRNIDKLVHLLFEHHPYDDIWDSFLKSASCPLNFSNKDFSGLFFKYMNVFADQWNFVNCDFSKSRWVLFILGNSKFLKCNFVEAMIRGDFFEDIYFSECNFSHAYLIQIGRSVMQGCNFNHARIKDIPLEGIRVPTFNNCNMQGCELIFNQVISYSTPKKILEDLNNIFSHEQLSSMSINFQGYSNENTSQGDFAAP